MNATPSLTWTWQQMSQVSGWSIPPLRTLATWCCPRWRRVNRWSSAKPGTPRSTSRRWPTPSWPVACSTQHDTSAKTWRRSSTRSTPRQGWRGLTLASSSIRCLPRFVPWTTALWTRCYMPTVTTTWCPTRFCFRKWVMLKTFSMKACLKKGSSHSDQHEQIKVRKLPHILRKSWPGSCKIKKITF